MTWTGIRNARKSGAWQSKFLEELRTHGVVRQACLASHITCTGAYHARTRAIQRRASEGNAGNDGSAPPAMDFAAQWDEAIRQAAARADGLGSDRSILRHGKLTLVRGPAMPAGSWHHKFLEELRNRGIVSDACRAARISHVGAYAARKRAIARRPAGATEVDDFASRWDAAIEEAIDRLEGEAWRRGCDGYPEPVFYRGRKVGKITRYSDGLLILLLKSHRPSKFRENVRHMQEVPPETRALLEKYYEAIGQERRAREQGVMQQEG